MSVRIIAEEYCRRVAGELKGREFTIKFGILGLWWTFAILGLAKCRTFPSHQH